MRICNCSILRMRTPILAFDELVPVEIAFISAGSQGHFLGQIGSPIGSCLQAHDSSRSSVGLAKYGNGARLGEPNVARNLGAYVTLTSSMALSTRLRHDEAVPAVG